MSDLRDLVYSISFQSNARDLRLIEQSTENLDRNIDNADGSLGNLNRTSQSSHSLFKSLGGAIAGAFAVKKIVDFGKMGISAFSNFEQGMANVNAAMGNVRAKSASDFKLLEDAALEWGAKTKYSATEASQALYFTASAGFDAKTQVQVLPKVLNLAAAGNIELARSAEISTTAMGALGLGANDLGKLIDQMGKTSQISQTNIAELGEGILTVGGVAKDANLNTEQLNAELAILADQGKKGAEGGTALRNVLLNLTAPNDTVAKLMKELGVRIADTSGKLRPLNSILVDLRKKMGGYTQAQQMAIKETIGGKENIQALNILLDGAGDKYNSLTSRIKNSTGAAQGMADVQNNTLKGAIENLTGSIESAFVKDMRDSSFGNSLKELVNILADKAPAAAHTAAGALHGVTDVLNWTLENKDLIISSFGGILGAILAYKSVMIIIEIYKAWKTATEATTLAQLALNNSLKINPIGLVIGLVAGLVAAFITAYKTSDTFRNGVNNLFTAIKDGAATAINFAIGKINDLIINANSAIGLINKIPGMNIKQIDLIGTLKTSKDIAKESARGQGGHIAIANEYARGTVNAAGGVSLVGEQGPELVNLGRGTPVTPANTTRRILGGSSSLEFNPNINITVAGGNDPQSTANAVKEAVRQQVEEMFAMASVQLGYTDLQPSV